MVLQVPTLEESFSTGLSEKPTNATGSVSYCNLVRKLNGVQECRNQISATYAHIERLGHVVWRSFGH